MLNRFLSHVEEQHLLTTPILMVLVRIGKMNGQKRLAKNWTALRIIQFAF